MREHYRHMVQDGLLQGGQLMITTTPEEAAAVLHAYDEGVDALDADERQHLNAVLAKLKDQIWP